VPNIQTLGALFRFSTT